MPTFKRKPLEVEAIQFMGLSNATPVVNWILENGGTARYHELEKVPATDDKAADVIPQHLAIDTREGTMKAFVGDWVIKEPSPVEDRKFYPCKPHIFDRTYDRVVTKGVIAGVSSGIVINNSASPALDVKPTAPIPRRSRNQYKGGAPSGNV